MNAPPPLPPRPSSPAATPATPPPALAPSAPIRDLEGLFRELVAVLAPVSIPAPPATPAPSDASLASLIPMNQRQLEILQRAEAERQNRVEKDAREREWRRSIHLGLAGIVILLEIVSQILRAYLEAHPVPPTPAAVYVAPASAATALPLPPTGDR